MEPERYELTAGPAYEFAPDRRDFLKILGGGLIVFVALANVDAQESGGGRARRGGQGQPKELGAWMHIGQDGRITFYTGKVEVGQNARTSLTQAVAEELGVPATAINLLMGDTDVTPYDMGTFGSLSTPQMAPQLRRAAAATRQWLLDLGAEHFQTTPDKLAIEAGLGGLPRVKNARGTTANIGEFTRGKLLSKTVEAGPVSKPKCESVPKVDGRAFVTGAHQYTSDITRPGMLHGKVLRPPAFGATLLEVKGAQVHDGNFVGVAADSPSLDEIKVEWKFEPQVSSTDLFAHLKKTAKSARKPALELDGAHKLETAYEIAYIAHTPLEPRAAVAEWNGDKLTVWTGTQRPFGVRTELAQVFGIPEEKIRVIVPDTGSGYGGKHTGECALEAARLAKSAGKPVKLVWTRQEEFTWAYWRPAGVIEVRSAIDASGLLTAWEFHNYNSGSSSIECPYAVANKQIQFHQSDSPLKQGSYRGLAATANNFARESHIDELAALAKTDPLEFRLANLKDDRMMGVLRAAAEKFRWGLTKPAGRGVGIACGFEKNGYVATCAEVSMQGGTIKVERLVSAFDCGAVVNPAHLKNQIEGAMVQGLGGALFEKAEFENGKLLTDRLAKYRVPRFSDVPPVLESVLVDRKDLRSAGAGETPIIGVAPAIASAIYNATGERRRRMPLG